MGSKAIKIEGICPYCGAKESVMFVDYCYGNSEIPYARNIPFCKKCDNDEIQLRKINNRRYKVAGKW